MNVLKDININIDDRKYLILLLIFSVSLTYFMFNFHLTRGAYNSDLYVYLAGALDLAGINSHNISTVGWIQNSPVIIFLTSLLFRLGFVDFSSILFVSGIFFIIGILGLYIFLKKRFSPLLSITGAILYSSLSLTLYYTASGMLDIPAVSLLIWTLIFTFAAVDKNPKYYLVVGLLFSISFFIRYTNTYIVALIFLYFLKNHDLIDLIRCFFKDITSFKCRVMSFIKSSELKWILISILTTSLIFFIVIWLLLSLNIEVGYLGAATSSTINHNGNMYDANYVADKWYFVKNFLNLLSCKSITFNDMFVERFNQPTIFSYLIMFILITGFIIKLINYIKNIDFLKEYSKSESSMSKQLKIFLIIAILILFIIARIGFKFNYLITQLSFFIIFLILMSIVKDYPINFDNFSVSILCLGLFSFYFIVVSYIDLKCFRYLLPAFPGFVYFVICSLDDICDFTRNYFDDEKSLMNKFYNKKIEVSDSLKFKLSKIIPIILIGVCLLFIFNFQSTVDLNQDGYDRIDFCNFIKEYDQDYQSKDMMSLYDVRYFEWYLNKDIKDTNDVEKLEPEKYDYIITFKEPFNYPNFREVTHNGYYYLNEKIQ